MVERVDSKIAGETVGWRERARKEESERESEGEGELRLAES